MCPLPYGKDDTLVQYAACHLLDPVPKGRGSLGHNSIPITLAGRVLRFFSFR